MSINLKNFVEEIEIKDLKNELNNINSYLYPNLDSAKILYQQAYLGKSKFKNISFKINYLKHTVICPLTIENEGNNNNLNFYGKPFSIFSEVRAIIIFNFAPLKPVINHFSPFITQPLLVFFAVV